MTLSLLLASTLLAAPLPISVPGDECPNCGATLPARGDSDARIERLIRRVLAESGEAAPKAHTVFGISTLGERAPGAAREARAKGFFVTDDGEAHEIDMDAEDVFVELRAPRAPHAPEAPHAPHAVRIERGSAPQVVIESKGAVIGPDGEVHEFHFGGGDGPHIVRFGGGDAAKKIEGNLFITSDGDEHEVHVGHDAPNVFRVRKGSDAPHVIQWTSDDEDVGVHTQKTIEVRVDGSATAPKTYTRTIVIGPDGVVHDSEEGDAGILHEAHQLHGIHEELQQGLHSIEIDLEGLDALEGLIGLEGLEGLKALKGLEGLEGLHQLKSLEGLGGELEVILESVGGGGDAPHVWHTGDGEVDFTFDVEVADESVHSHGGGTGEAPRVIQWTSESHDAEAPRVERRQLRRAERTAPAVDEVEAQIEALNAEIERLERRLERLLKDAKIS